MTSILPIGIGQILSGAVESTRLELKATWDPNTTGGQVLQTLCAFANDLQNLNGGYLIIGVEERAGVAVRPVRGLREAELDAAQRWIRGNCNRIEPTYMPVFDTPEVDGGRVLVLWAPASDNRPHQAPDGSGPRRYWVRIGSETVAARDAVLDQLMQQTARVPFDDRRAFDAGNEDLRGNLVREFLTDVQSDLRYEQDVERVYLAMQIVARANSHTVPRNVGLMFFSEDPERWFRGARIEVAEFSDDAGGNLLEERTFKGPIHHQLRQCLTWLENMTTRHLEKQSRVPETRGWVSYPVPALREALVNAVYHRGYDPGTVEPTKVYLYPNRVEIISYPGPVHGITLDHLRGEKPLPPVPARNRRIGEFLKEIRLAEARGTGIPKIYRSMRENGSPVPGFDFDDDRTYCRVTLPAHPEYVALIALRDYSYQRATGDDEGALRVLEAAWASGQRSPAIAFTLVRDYVERRDLAAARNVVETLPESDRSSHPRMLTAYASGLLDAGQSEEAEQVLNRLPAVMAASDAFEAAIAERRAGRRERAHRYFQSAGDLVLADVRALHEFAQTKMQLAAKVRHGRRPSDRQVRKRLLHEAAEFLERVVQMDAPAIRHAWAYFDLGRVLRWMGRPKGDVVRAIEHAVRLAPGEAQFRRELERVSGDNP